MNAGTQKNPGRGLALVLALTLGLSACGSGTPTPPATGNTGGTTGTPLTTTGGGAVDTTPLSTATFDKGTLTSFSQTTNTKVQGNVTQVAAGARFGVSGVGVFSMGRGGVGTLDLKLQDTDPCADTNGDTTDGDRDGIYKSFTATFNCSGTYSGIDLTYKGT